MTRTEKFFKNTLVAAFYQVILMLVGFVLPKLMLTYYGSEVNGVVTSISQFISYFVLVEAGLSSAAIYALYKPLAKNDTKSINGIMVATHRLYLLSGAIFLILLLGLSVLYPFGIHVEKISPYELSILVFSIGLTSVVDFFTLGKYRALLEASQKNYIVYIASIAYYLICVMIIWISACLGYNVETGRLLASFALIVRSLILIVVSKKIFPYLDFKEKPLNENLSKRWSALYLQVITAVQKGTPVILLTLFGSMINLSIYAVYNMVLQGVRGILDIFVTGLSSGFGEIIVKGEKNALQRAYADFELLYYSLITVVYGVAFVMILPFVDLYTRSVGDACYITQSVAFLSVLNSLLYNLKTPQGMMVISAGLFRETRVQTTVQAAIVIALGIPLCIVMGIEGVLVALSVSNMYRVIDLVLFVPKYVTKMSPCCSIKRICVVIVNIGLIISVNGICQSSIDTITQWFIEAIKMSCISITFVLILGFILEKANIIRIYGRVKSLIGERP